MRTVAFPLAFALLACLASPSFAESFPVRATPLILDAHDPARRSVGRLEWRGGVALSAENRRFGGFSGILLGDGGRSLRAISDVGFWMETALQYGADGRLSGMGEATVGALNDEAGKPLSGGAQIDAESLTLLADGRLLVGFERSHRILVYPAGEKGKSAAGLAGTPRRIALPPGLDGAPNNDGLEALATLPDGRVLAVSEDLKAGPGSVRGWIGTASGADFAWQELAYRVVGAFRPTGAAALPNGDVLLTERSFNPVEGVRVRVMLLRGNTILPGATLEAEELAQLVAPVVTENLESLDVATLPDGRIGIWIMGDDNFNPMQRTILLHFALTD